MTLQENTSLESKVPTRLETSKKSRFRESRVSFGALVCILDATFINFLPMAWQAKSDNIMIVQSNKMCLNLRPITVYRLHIIFPSSSLFHDLCSSMSEKLEDMQCYN